MTEEIIIDGVNVAGCSELYQVGEMLCVDDGIEEPCHNRDCYYKQLQRLKQENEKLREAMHKDFCSHYVLGECSKKHHNNCVGRNQCIKDLEDSMSLFINSHKTEQDRRRNFEQALEEIRECAKFAQSLPCADIDCDCANCNDETTNNGQFCMEKRINEIKQIVNEVLNDSHTN